MSSASRITTMCAVAFAVAAAAAAQSLGDVARKEEERRKAAQKSGKIYTNEALKGHSGSPVPPPAQPAPSSDAAAKPVEPAKPDAAAERKKEEAAWRARITEARQGLERAQMFKEALQTRINSLSNDFASRDDPAQRSVVASNRHKAMAELDRVTKEIAEFEKQIATIEEEARKAGVPPGWLR